MYIEHVLVVYHLYTPKLRDITDIYMPAELLNVVAAEQENGESSTVATNSEKTTFASSVAITTSSWTALAQIIPAAESARIIAKRKNCLGLVDSNKENHPEECFQFMMEVEIYVIKKAQSGL